MSFREFIEFTKVTTGVAFAMTIALLLVFLTFLGIEATFKWLIVAAK